MIKEVTMYTVICDNCGADVNKDQEYSCWGDRGYARDFAVDADWVEVDDKHYCDQCFSYDDGNLVIDELRKKIQP